MGRLRDYGLVGIVFLLGSRLVLAAELRREFRATYELRPGAVVSLENVWGDIVVTAWDEPRAEVVALKVGPADQVDRVEVSVDATPLRLAVRTVYPDREWGRPWRVWTRFWRWEDVGVAVHYTLRVPRDVHLDPVRSVRGDVTVSDVRGRVVVHSVEGSLRVSRVGRDLDLCTVRGDVTVADVGGRARVRSVSGTIEARDVTGDLEIKAVSGDVDVRQVGGHLRAESVSGDVRFGGSLHEGRRYELKSLSGDIEVVLPPDAGFVVEASTFSGAIETDFPVQVRGRLRARSIVGTVGPGGPTLVFRTLSGDIRLRKTT